MSKQAVVGILAHVDAGKTTLAEAMLFNAGRIRKRGRVDDGDSHLDTNAIERERGITIFSSQAVLDHGDAHVMLVDAPGHVDFSAEAERTLRALDAAQLVDEIIIATREDRLLEVADLCRRCGLRKPVRVVQGGENRTQSVLAAACEADAKAQFIAVHDGARPLVLPGDVDAVIRFACQTHAAAPALPVTDTVKTADETGRVTGTPDRSTLFAVQTPQVFQADVLKAALQSAAEAKLPLTDDCAAVERLGKQVDLLPGNPENIKITRPLDLAVAAAILRQREERNA